MVFRSEKDGTQVRCLEVSVQATPYDRRAQAIMDEGVLRNYPMATPEPCCAPGVFEDGTVKKDVDGAFLLNHGTSTEVGLHILRDGRLQNSTDCSLRAVYFGRKPSEIQYYIHGAVVQCSVAAFPLSAKNSTWLRNRYPPARPVPIGTMCHFTDKSVPHEIAVDRDSTQVRTVTFNYRRLQDYIETERPELRKQLPNFPDS